MLLVQEQTYANSKPTNIPSLLLVRYAHMKLMITLVPTSNLDCLWYANTERGGLGDFGHGNVK